MEARLSHGTILISGRLGEDNFMTLLLGEENGSCNGI